MSGKNKMVLSNRLYVPLKAWKNIPSPTRKRLVKLFNKTFISPSSYCELIQVNRRCINYENEEEDNGKEAAEDLCKECPMAKKKLVCAFKNRKYVSFYRGDLEKVEQVTSMVRKYNPGIVIQDKQALSPLKKKIKILDIGDERNVSQDKLAKKYVKEGYGIIKAAARFGKTRTACVVASLLNQKTFVLAHQRELLEQFQSNWTKFSSLSKSDIKINPSLAEAKKLPVSLFTYQHFLHKHGSRRLKEMCKIPGLVVIDEVHRAAAPEFNRIVNKFHAKYRLGITATPNRKDKMSFLIFNTFGPVTAKGGVEMLSCKYKVIKTELIFPDYEKVQHRRRFLYLQAALAKNEERNNIIANRAVRNVDKGYKVLIPLKGVAHVKTIATLIRGKLKKAGYRDPRVCEYSAAFMKKGKQREEISQQVREGFYDVVVAVESMINVGFDAPKISNLVLNAGIYSFNKENRYQLFSRIRTKCEGKKTPLIDILADHCKWSDYSLKGILQQMEEYKFTPVKKKK